jgi:sterol 24-C-methyltransferase
MTKTQSANARQFRSFDGVYTVESLVHASEPQSALKEFLRVLKPGGRLVLFEYSMPAQRDLSETEREAFAAINTDSAMYSFPEFENGRFDEILTAAGFDFSSVTDIRYRIAQCSAYGHHLLGAPSDRQVD